MFPTLRIDDPSAYEENSRGRLTDAQRTQFHPLFVLIRSFSEAAIGAPILGFAAWVGMSGARESFDGLPPWAELAAAATTFAVVGAPFLYAALRKQSVVLREVQLGMPTVAEGRVTWKKNRYVAETLDGRMLQPFSGKPGLAPGPYRFALFPESRMLLSAKPVGSEKDQDLALTEILGSFLHADALALESNRSGMVTAAQRSRALLPSKILGAYAALSIIADIAVLGFFRDVIGEAAPILGISALMTGIIAGGVAWWMAQRAQGDRTEMLEGEAQIEIRQTKNSRTATLTIAGRRFSINPVMADAFPAKGRYRAYTFPKGTTLLSIEAVADSPETNNAHPVEE